MPYSSLEDFIKAADAIGEVEFVEGADSRIGRGLSHRAFGRAGRSDARLR